jgi:hypothetical protein
MTEHLARSFDINRLPPEFLDDPFPTYHALRNHDPVHRSPDGSYILTRYDDVIGVYKDFKAWSSDKKVEFKPKFGDSPLYEHHTTSLVFRDPPDHTRIRRLFGPAFTPRALSLLQPRVEKIVDGFLDQAERKGGMDIVADYAFALPVELIGDMLGVPRPDRWRLRDWSLAILGALEPVPTAERLEAGNRSVDEFKAYLRDLITDRRRNPGDGADGEILSALIAGEDDDAMTEIDLLHQCIFLLNAGHETTTNLIGSGVHELLLQPDQLATLRADPDLIEPCIEECLRYQSPNQLGNRRALADCAVGGIEMPTGTLVTMCIGGANRDPAQFAEPDKFDIARGPNRHLAFGMGIHICAGNSLARMEGIVAIARLFGRFRQVEIAGPVVRGGRARFRGLASLPVTVA